MRIIINEHTVNTKKYGALKISALTNKQRVALAKLLDVNKLSDKDIFLRFLQSMLIQPKLTQNDLIALSNNVLIRIGKEIIKANNLIIKNDQKLKGVRLNYFTKFRKILEQENIAWVKVIEKQKLPFQGISDKSKTSFLTTHNLINDIRKKEIDYRRFGDISSNMLSPMDTKSALESIRKTFVGTQSAADSIRKSFIDTESAIDSIKRTFVNNQSAIESVHSMLSNSQLGENLLRQREGINQLANLKDQQISSMDHLTIRNNIDSIVDAFNSKTLVNTFIFSSIPVHELKHMQALITNHSFQDFLRTFMQTAEDIFREPNFTEEFKDNHIEDARIIIENAKKGLSKLRSFSGPQLTILGIYLSDFINGIKDINVALEKDNLESWNALMIVSVLILKLCAVIYALQKDAKEL